MLLFRLFPVSRNFFAFTSYWKKCEKVTMSHIKIKLISSDSGILKKEDIDEFV
jgi:hypothetical protein